MTFDMSSLGAPPRSRPRSANGSGALASRSYGNPAKATRTPPASSTTVRGRSSTWRLRQRQEGRPETAVAGLALAASASAWAANEEPDKKAASAAQSTSDAKKAGKGMGEIGVTGCAGS